MLSVLADIVALAAVQIVGAEVVSSIFYGNKHFQMETLCFS